MEILRPPEAVQGRESKVKKGDAAKTCAPTCTEFGGKNLEVLLEEFQQALGQVEPRCLASESVLFSRLDVKIEECPRLD